MPEFVHLGLAIPDEGVRSYLVQVSDKGGIDISDGVDFAWIVGDHENLDSTDEFLAKLP